MLKTKEEGAWYGKKHTEEYKQKMSLQMQEKWKNLEYREKACENMKKNHANVKGGNNPQAKEVYCIEKDIKFPSCRDMAEFFNFENVNVVTAAKGIARACRGERTQYKGYHFIWAKEENESKEEN